MGDAGLYHKPADNSGLRGPGYDTFAGSGRHLGTPATTVLYVDSLATDSSNTNSTHGSLKWCLHQTFPRVIVPAISGVISFPVNSVIVVSDPYFTYAGQCAPGDGLHVHRCMLNVSTKQGLVWHWSGFMQDATTQGTADVIQLGSTSIEDQTDLIVANCTGMYGMDETMSVFNSSQSYVSDFTFWQCHMGSAPRGGDSGGYAALIDLSNGPGISGDAMPEGALLRSYMSNCTRRNPLIVGGIIESSNNLVYGADFNEETISRDGTTHAEAMEHNFRGNGFVLGDGTDYEAFNLLDVGEWDLGGYYYSSNTVQSSAYTDPEWNNSTPTNYPPGDTAPQATPSSNATPEGWVTTTITDSDAGLLGMQELMDATVGARPNDRLAVHQQELDWCANYLNSTTPIGSHTSAALDPPTVASVTINHELTGSHGVGPIPTTGKDVVQGSGYTLLEEWLHDHHAFFMPVGWDQ